jgi:glycosyltransferase involved in cell wall biosynthesis
VIVQRPTYYVAVGTKNAQPYYQGTFLRYAVDHRPAGQHTASRPFNPSRLNLHWIIPDFSSGGGGHMTIFRMVRALSLRGHQQTVWVHGYGHASGDHAFDDIVKHYQTLNAKVLRIEEADITHARADAVIATDWASVFIAQSMEATKRVFYFVQDYEPYFYPRGSEALLAESTYEADVDCLCASPWLANKMSQTFGRWARGFHLASDLDVYHPGHSRTNAHSTGGAPRIAFYARSFTARRAVELGLLALEELARRGERFVVDVFGAETSVETAPFPFVNHGVLTPEQLAELYRASTIGVVFSATNYSLVPQEMMASGLPVVDLDVESTRAIYPPNVVTFAKPNPIAIADALQHLLRDAERRGDQREAALNWVSQFSWSGAADVVELSIVGRLRELGHVASPAIQSMTSTAPKASVVIPTWNGGQLLLDVLERVKQQVHVDAFEIIVIDSGSNDGTLEVMQADERILLHRIKQSDFGHGKTRNLGVELSRGEYVAFLTQDAMPASTTWLADYVLLLDHFPHAGGAFGRHLAWPSASPFTKRDINAHFEQFFHHPIAVSKDTNRERWDADDPSWRQLLHYYSDNNSCLRRSVWAKIPYRDVAYGEDQLFAHDIVSAGYQKVFAPGAVVYHSHDYDEAQTFERSRIEAAFFKQFFGYILMDDEGTLKKVLEGINGSDMQWARAHGVGEAELERQLRLNEARLRGYLAGDRSVGRVQERRRG